MGRARKPRVVTGGAAPAANDAPSKFRDEAEPIEDLMPGFATFVGEEPAELAHALVGPDRATNYDRLAVPPPPAPVQAPRRPAPRRVSAEVVKAETALLNLARRREDSLAHAESVWAAKRVALIRSFPADVLAALDAMNIVEGEELEGLEP